MKDKVKSEFVCICTYFEHIYVYSYKTHIHGSIYKTSIINQTCYSILKRGAQSI